MFFNGWDLCIFEQETKFGAMLKTLVVLTFVGSSLSGCTHAVKIANPADQPVRSPCTNIDWFETGRGDGAVGSSLSKLAIYQERCDKTPFPVRLDQYTTGRETGLVEFCSPIGGLEAGRSLRPYQKVCPEHREEEFLTQYELGKRIRNLENDRSELEARIINLRNLLSPDARPESSIQQQIEQLKNRQAQITQEMMTLENKPPTTSVNPVGKESSVN
jgi:hypothetical protein